MGVVSVVVSECGEAHYQKNPHIQRRRNPPRGGGVLMADKIIIIRDRQENPPVDHSYESDVGRYWKHVDKILLGRKSGGRD